MQIYDSIRSSFIDLIFIFVCCGIGSIIKDMYNTLTGKDTKVKLIRILISTIVSCFVMFSSEDILLKYMSTKVFMLISFISGLVGFEIASKLTSLDNVLKILSKINFKK